MLEKKRRRSKVNAEGKGILLKGKISQDLIEKAIAKSLKIQGTEP